MDEFEAKRIINLPAESAPAAGDVFVVDNQETGTKKLAIADLIEDEPTENSKKAASSGGVFNKIADVTDEITELKQDIINGKVSIDAGVEDILPIAADFRVARITPKNGTVTANRETFMVVDGENATYYPLLSTGFLSEDIKTIQGNDSNIKFILFAYDKATEEYLGAIYREYTFKSKEDLESDNKLYPYSEVNIDTLNTAYQNYKYRFSYLTMSKVAVFHHGLYPVYNQAYCTENLQISEQTDLHISD